MFKGQKTTRDVPTGTSSRLLTSSLVSACPDGRLGTPHRPSRVARRSLKPFSCGTVPFIKSPSGDMFLQLHRTLTSPLGHHLKMARLLIESKCILLPTALKVSCSRLHQVIQPGVSKIRSEARPPILNVAVHRTFSPYSKIGRRPRSGPGTLVHNTVAD